MWARSTGRARAFGYVRWCGPGSRVEGIDVELRHGRSARTRLSLQLAVKGCGLVFHVAGRLTGSGAKDPTEFITALTWTVTRNLLESRSAGGSSNARCTRAR